MKKKITKTIDIQYDDKILIINRGPQDRLVLSLQEAIKIAEAIVAIKDSL